MGHKTYILSPSIKCSRLMCTGQPDMTRASPVSVTVLSRGKQVRSTASSACNVLALSRRKNAFAL